MNKRYSSISPVLDEPRNFDTLPEHYRLRDGVIDMRGWLEPLGEGVKGGFFSGRRWNGFLVIYTNKVTEQYAYVDRLKS